VLGNENGKRWTESGPIESFRITCNNNARGQSWTVALQVVCLGFENSTQPATQRKPACKHRLAKIRNRARQVTQSEQELTYRDRLSVASSSSSSSLLLLLLLHSTELLLLLLVVVSLLLLLLLLLCSVAAAKPLCVLPVDRVQRMRLWRSIESKW
jgi:hypothetical protein